MTLGYFLDEMQTYELHAILDSLEYTYRNEWEQARLISYIVAQTQSSKQLHVNDIIEFTWDKEKSDNNQKEVMTKEDVDRLSKKMNDIVEENKTKSQHK